MAETVRVWPGLPYPLGAIWDGSGTNSKLSVALEKNSSNRLPYWAHALCIECPHRMRNRQTNPTALASRAPTDRTERTRRAVPAHRIPPARRLQLLDTAPLQPRIPRVPWTTRTDS